MRLRGVLQSLQIGSRAHSARAPARNHEQTTRQNAPRRRRCRQPAPCRTRPDGGSRIPFKLGLIVVVASLCSGLATYLILTGLTPIVPTHRVVVGVLLINLDARAWR